MEPLRILVTDEASEVCLDRFVVGADAQPPETVEERGWVERGAELPTDSRVHAATPVLPLPFFLLDLQARFAGGAQPGAVPRPEFAIGVGARQADWDAEYLDTRGARPGSRLMHILAFAAERVACRQHGPRR